MVFELSNSFEFKVQLNTHNFGLHIVNISKKCHITSDHYLLKEVIVIHMLNTAINQLIIIQIGNNSLSTTSAFAFIIAV